MTDTSKDAVDRLVLAIIRSGNTTAANMLNALAVERDAANTRADAALDAALEDVAKDAHAFAAENQWHPSSVTKLVTRILALRDKPAPAVTVQEAAMVLLDLLKTPSEKAPIEASHIEDVWTATFRKSGFAAVKGFLSAIAGGGDE